MNTLVDTGASHCFINPKFLPIELISRIEEFKANPHAAPDLLGLTLVNASMQTINNSNTHCRAVKVYLTIQIENWRGQQEFIVSDMIENEACILGRNFLISNKVRIDYGTSYMEIPVDGEVTDTTSLARDLLNPFMNSFYKYLSILFMFAAKCLK